MADNSILTPGYLDSVERPTPETVQYLVKDNLLSEYNDEEKAIVRENLNVPSIDDIPDQLELNSRISTEIRDVMQEHLNLEDPHGILPVVEDMIDGMVKTDGSTPFIVPLSGIDPLTDNHLTTKRFVNRLLNTHIDAEDPHNILPEVLIILEKYAKTSDVYNKSLIYTKGEVEEQFKNYVRRDGSTPFTKAQVGIDPTLDSHLSTKRYVDKVIYNHIVDVDPHNFLTILNNRLSSYIKKKDVFDKTLTYSRTLIDSIINQVVELAVDYSILEYIDSINDKFEYIRKLKYVKLDGSIPFSKPLLGVDAVEDADLVTFRQLKQVVLKETSNLNELIDKFEWITSGPVSTTVGHVSENTIFNDTVSFQEIMDRIFYGRGILLDVPDYVIITKVAPITVCVLGASAEMLVAELLQDGLVIHVFTAEDFTDHCITVDSLPILEDSTITFRVTYTNGTIHDETKLIHCASPIFIGLLPKWKFGNTVTFDYLIQSSEKDPINNKFYGVSSLIDSLIHTYQFKDDLMNHPYLVIPKDYPDLYRMSIPSLQFRVEAFDVIDMIPLKIPGVDKDIIYKIYIYKQALSSLDLKVNFEFQ